MKTMASRLQNKISVDVAADKSSADSFSFAGLVCVQDQQAKSLDSLQCNKPNHIQKQSSDFEFSTIEESFVTDPIKQRPADLLISNGQIVSQPIKCQSTQHMVTKQQRKRSSARATRASRKSSTDNTSGRQASDKPNPEFSPEFSGQKKEHSVSSSWFGQKIFKSFFFPCKESQAVKPTLRSDRMAEENRSYIDTTS